MVINYLMYRKHGYIYEVVIEATGYNERKWIRENPTALISIVLNNQFDSKF